MNGINYALMTASSVGEKTSLFWEMVQVLAALVILLPLVFVVTRLYALKMRGPSSTRLIELVDRVVLGNRRSLVLVRVGKRVFFLSVMDKEVVKLGEWEDDGNLPLPNMTADETSFAAVFRRVLQKREQGANRDEK